MTAVLNSFGKRSSFTRLLAPVGHASTRSPELNLTPELKELPALLKRIKELEARNLNKEWSMEESGEVLAGNVHSRSPTHSRSLSPELTKKAKLMVIPEDSSICKEILEEPMEKIKMPSCKHIRISADEMLGIYPEVMEHRLNVKVESRLVKQKLRNFSAKKNKAIQEEVDKLLATKFIEPCDYPENQWAMENVSGFYRLEPCLPKRLLPPAQNRSNGRLNKRVQLLSFMDAFSGYHQISLYEPDRKKAAFITDWGVFKYVEMPFDLKNAVTTF
ncbi:uncharacterized protein LOC110727405 [Chenopodium quinoa]|uniref:uncharacterized protein LOC110727405 n=1 Tax=Chenopodium quinoa TaxID=63459 RepID=UPI000B78FB8F|nr:uncharacterized protein LOC110727405 [Chenopodium quinoa]